MRHSLARSASETVLETAPSLVALADLHVQASAIRKRFASIEMSEHLMREAISMSSDATSMQSQKDAPFGLNSLGELQMREAIRCDHRRTHPSASIAWVSSS